MKNKIILYYCFTPISDPEAIKQWQKALCESVNLRGRILISKHGINGTLGGDMDDLKKSREVLRELGFTDPISYKRDVETMNHVYGTKDEFYVTM